VWEGPALNLAVAGAVHSKNNVGAKDQAELPPGPSPSTPPRVGHELNMSSITLQIFEFEI